MKKTLMSNSIDISHYIIDKKLEKGMTVIDATVGNGKDTLLLSKKVGNKGIVYGFDIQEMAIENTSYLLKKNNSYENVRLINDSHEHLLKYIDKKIDLVIFNLGYLPKGNHKIITKAESTVKGIENSLFSLKISGMVIIVSYYGHKGGSEEKKCIENYLNKLNQNEFTVFKLDFINQINNPPVLFCIERIC